MKFVENNPFSLSTSHIDPFSTWIASLWKFKNKNVVYHLSLSVRKKYFPRPEKCPSARFWDLVKYILITDLLAGKYIYSDNLLLKYRHLTRASYVWQIDKLSRLACAEGCLSQILSVSDATSRQVSSCCVNFRSLANYYFEHDHVTTIATPLFSVLSSTVFCENTSDQHSGEASNSLEHASNSFES